MKNEQVAGSREQVTRNRDMRNSEYEIEQQHCYLVTCKKRCVVLVPRGFRRRRYAGLGLSFVDSEIVAIQRRYNVISIVTRASSVFNAHEKMKAFNVFKKVKHPAGNDE
jgi:hypothetical protein